MGAMTRLASEVNTMKQKAQIHVCFEICGRLRGRVYGHPRFADGGYYLKSQA